MSIFKKRIKKAEEHKFCSAVVVAAGVSERMGFDKLMAPLNGRPVIAHTLSAFQTCGCIDEIIVVTQPEKIVEIAHICRDYGIIKASKIITGGETRLHSSLAGLSEIDPRAKLAAIHDGARPLVTEAVIVQAVHAAVLYKAAAPAIPLRDTVKFAEKGIVCSTPDRALLAAVQTPQVFDADIVKAALTAALEEEYAATDDCAAVERLGVKVHLTQGSEENLKITVPLDLLLAELILGSRGTDI